MFGWRLVRVTGNSMRPKLPAHTYCLFRPSRTIQPGDIVLVDHPEFGRIIKQARTVSAAEIWLEGTGLNSVSTDAMGAVSLASVRGRLVWSSRPPSTR